ncbi:MAG: response regulator [Oscillatoria sp. SIO1A7]|nr:response regulator [Oscillatoria sp. SIO1A7]
MQNTAILCVDDEEVILESIKEQLKRKFNNQYIYEVAQSATEAWDIIEELQEDGVQILIVVSDWLMPEIKGDEFLIQVHNKFPNIIKMMLTGQADRAAIERTQKEANLFACLHKPWTEDELADAIISGLEAADE